MTMTKILAILMALSTYAIYSHPQGPFQYQGYGGYQGPPQYPMWSGPYQPIPYQGYGGYQGPYQGFPDIKMGQKRTISKEIINDNFWNRTDDQYRLKPSIAGYQLFEIPYNREGNARGISKTTTMTESW